MDSFDEIFYQNCPHFTVGNVDQWGEQGYLLHERKVYSYEEDRKNQCGRTYAPMSVVDFLTYAEREGIIIPEGFLRELNK
jgi:hypothetical protein